MAIIDRLQDQEEVRSPTVLETTIRQRPTRKVGHYQQRPRAWGTAGAFDYVGCSSRCRTSWC